MNINYSPKKINEKDWRNEKKFLYATIVHELGHALAIPHMDGSSLMNRAPSCQDIRENQYCGITNEVLDYFLGYYIDNLPQKLKSFCERSGEGHCHSKYHVDYLYHPCLGEPCRKEDIEEQIEISESLCPF